MSKMRNRYAYMSWLENKIYILYCDSPIIRVFTDQAPGPFDKSLEAIIQIPELEKSTSMVSNAVSRSIFISDEFGYIYKIQMPTGDISRWKFLSLDGKSGAISRMSNSTVSDNCLVTSFVYNDYEYESIRFELQLFSQLDGDLHRYSVIPLPKEMTYIGHVAHSPKNNFVISYSETFPPIQCLISIFSCDGEKIRTFEPELGSVLKNPGNSTFSIDEDGQIFIGDYAGNKVIWLNSNLTDYRIIAQKDREIGSPCSIVYIKEKRQLLVQEMRGDGLYGLQFRISIFHLSPCHLV